jgi:hypothetical protein
MHHATCGMLHDELSERASRVRVWTNRVCDRVSRLRAGANDFTEPHGRLHVRASRLTTPPTAITSTAQSRARRCLVAFALSLVTRAIQSGVLELQAGCAGCSSHVTSMMQLGRLPAAAWSIQASTQSSHEPGESLARAYQLDSRRCTVDSPLMHGPVRPPSAGSEWPHRRRKKTLQYPYM